MKSWIRFVSVVFVLGLQGVVTADELWEDVITPSQTSSDGDFLTARKVVGAVSQASLYQKSRTVKLNEQEMQLSLGRDTSGESDTHVIAARKSLGEVRYQISVPLPDGSSTHLRLSKENILPAGLAEKFPEISTYRVHANERVFSGKVDMTRNGFHAMLQTLDGETIFIDPVDLSQGHYVTYKKSDQIYDVNQSYSCGVNAHDSTINSFRTDLSSSSSLLNPSLSASLSPELANRVARQTANSLITYTIAIATTGEYTAKHGGTVEGAMSAISTTLNRVNQVLERDLGIRLNLVENNHLLINTDAGSDPFTNPEARALVEDNQVYIDSIIGNANYDIGHLFTASGGGLAFIGSVCNNPHKAKGVSGISNPRGDAFDLNFVAHEIGHQLGATHTFNSLQGSCSSNTRTARTAFEPGSGSSIMSYAGFCGADNLQSNKDAMYHIGSIKQITDFTGTGIGSRCGVRQTSKNMPPQPDAGKNFVIPARTPFELEGKAVDSDNDQLVYAWEQLDAGDSSDRTTDKGNNALFRVHAPTSQNIRSFPPLSDVLNHTESKGETLPKVNRFIRLSFVAQDGFNVAQSDEMSLQVEQTGSRFALNLPRSQYTVAKTYPIYWNVANTDKAPINCQSVDVSLSLDGGLNFGYLLAENIANTGETSVTIPADIPLSRQGRFKLKCSDNVFYAVSYRNFVLTDKETQVTFKYDDENLAERDLHYVVSPVTESNSSTVSTSSASSSNSSSGGGLFDIFGIFMGVVLLFRRCYLNHY